MRTRLYQLFLKSPGFRGKSRAERLLREAILPEAATRLPGGFRMALDPMEWAQRDLLANGCLEPKTTKLYEKLLGAGDTYVDVGCHVGYHTLVARTLIGPDGAVIAVDPQPYNCERTLRNWRINRFDNITVFVAAAGAEEGQVKLPDQPAEDKSRLSLRDSPTGGRARSFGVPVRRLESLLAAERVSRVTLLKVDTEGYELEVARGLGAAIAGVENMILEVLPEAFGPGGVGRELVAYLDKAGFQLRDVEGRGWTQPEPLAENNLWACRAAPGRST